MNSKNGIRGRFGFSLLEVLVAVAILSFGLLALATLQIALVRASSETRSQSEALSLGKERLERLRSYTSLAGYQALTSGTDSVAIGGVAYSRTWTVTRYVYNQDVDNDGVLNEANDAVFQSTATLTGPTPTSPAGFVGNNEFKVVKVVTSWVDPTGSQQAVALEDATGAISPGDSANVAKLPAAAVARKIPVIIKNPSADTMVIPIAIGDGTDSAATNPKPQVVIGTSTVETQFDVLSYIPIDSTEATAQQRTETIMVGCTCDFGQAPASTVRGKRPTYWDGARYVVPVSTTGAPPAGVDAASVNLQSPRCDICCRDHHDPVGTAGGLFSPLLATRSNGVVTAAHPHFLNKSTVTPTTSGTYKEACRLIRIDGQWRVAADLNNDYFALLATGNGTDASTPVPDSTSIAGTPSVTGAVARYQQFVLDYLYGRFAAPTPSAGSEQATYNTVNTGGVAPKVMAAGVKYVLDSPASVAIAGNNLAGKWLHSRGMYVDYLEQDAVNAITSAKDDATCTVDSTTLSACILKLIPFTSINLTEIADWTPLTTPLKVTNFDYSTSLAYGYPIRGKVTTAATEAATLDAMTYARKTNSGLLDLSFESISPADDVKLTDTQPFSIVAPFVTATTGKAGTLKVNVSGYGTELPYVSSYITGEAVTTSCGLASPYICAVSGGLDADGALSLDVGGYNHQQIQNTTANLTGCLGTANAATFGPKNTSGETYAGSVCKNYQVTNVTTTSPSPGTISWAALAPYSAADGTVAKPPGEVTRVTFTGKLASSPLWAPLTDYAVGDIVVSTSAPIKTYTSVANFTSGLVFNTANWTARSDIDVSITLGLQATTVQTATSCTYYCGNGNAGNQIDPSGTTCKAGQFKFQATYPTCP